MLCLTKKEKKSCVAVGVCHPVALGSLTSFESNQFHEGYNPPSNTAESLLDFRRKSQNWRSHQLWMWKSNQRPLFSTSQVKIAIFFWPIFTVESLQIFLIWGRALCIIISSLLSSHKGQLHLHQWQMLETEDSFALPLKQKQNKVSPPF